MAITSDLSKRDCYFENNTPVNNPLWDSMFKNLRDSVWGCVGQQQFEIGRDLISQGWNGIRDQWTGLLLVSCFEQFENYCKSCGLLFEVSENGNYIVKKDWDNYFMSNTKLCKRSNYITK